MRRNTKFAILLIVLVVLTIYLLWKIAADENTVQTYGISEASAEISSYNGTDDKESMKPTTTTTLPVTTTTSPPVTTVPQTTTTASEPEVVPQDGIDWYAIYECESAGYGWAANTGNGYYGGLQFHQDTWVGAGGLKYAERADLAEPWQQIAIASTLPLSHWPNCGKFG